MVDRKTAAQMREEGMTYQAIAEVFGVSRQRIEQVLKKKVNYTRKYFAEIESIPYEGIYNYLAANPKVTITSLAVTMFGYSNNNTNTLVRRFLNGHNCKMGKKAYDRLIATTGMTYEQLFKLREGFKEARTDEDQGS